MLRAPWILRLSSICILMYAAAWAMYTILPKSTQSNWTSYIPLKIKGESTTVATHFQNSGTNSVLSLDTAEVFFQEFSQKNKRNLRYIAATYDPEDLRIDPFIQGMTMLFTTAGYEWVFLSNERSRVWINQQMKKNFPELEWSFGNRVSSLGSPIAALIVCIASLIVAQRMRIFAFFIFAIFVALAPMFYISTILLLAMLLQAAMILAFRVFHEKSSATPSAFIRIEIAAVITLFVGVFLFILFRKTTELFPLLVLYLAGVSVAVLYCIARYHTIKNRDHSIFRGYRLVRHRKKAMVDPKMIVFLLTALACIVSGFLPLRDTALHISPHMENRDDSLVSKRLFVHHSKYQEALLYGYSFEDSRDLTEIVIPTFSMDDAYTIESSSRSLLLDDHWEHILFENLSTHHAMQLLLREHAEGLLVKNTVHAAPASPLWVLLLLWISSVIVLFSFHWTRYPLSVSRPWILYSLRLQWLWKFGAK